MILIIDNYDSVACNRVQSLGGDGPQSGGVHGEPAYGAHR